MKQESEAIGSRFFCGVNPKKNKTRKRAAIQDMYIFAASKAGVVKLVDTLDLGSSAARCVGSSPSARTEKRLDWFQVVFFVFCIYFTHALFF